MIDGPRARHICPIHFEGQRLERFCGLSLSSFLSGPISDLTLVVLLVDDGVRAVVYGSIPLSSDLVHLLQELLAIVLLQASAGNSERIHGISYSDLISHESLNPV